MSSLRERKRTRTREAIIEAAAELFERRGYDGTTIADIAAAADISTRTFFSYFGSKDDVLFPDADARVLAALTAIDERRPDERPTEILVARPYRTRRRRRRSRRADGRTAIAVHAHRFRPCAVGAYSFSTTHRPRSPTGFTPRFPMSSDEVEAAALVGAFVGAIGGALEVLLRDDDDPDALRERLQRATAVALQPWT